MISETMLSDERFNGISMAAQNIFLRMLAVSDDCGVVPAGTYRLNVLINTPPKLQRRVQEIVDEIVAAGMGHRFDYASEAFFAFKPDSFQDYQSYILAKATKSEYLRISKDEFLGISKNFLENPDRVTAGASRTVESRKQRAESKEQRVESKEIKTPYGEFKNVLLTSGEWEQLVAKLGADRLKVAVEILSSYKKSKGKEYKSDYATFSTWVIGELEKRESHGGASTGRSGGGRGNAVSPNKVTPEPGKYDGVETIIDTSGK